MSDRADAVTIAPSILSANMTRLGSELDDVLTETSWLHLDVMDGHFVPNITIGPHVIKAIRAHTDAFLDAHLMVADPLTWVPAFLEAGADQATFHIDATTDPLAVIDAARAAGGKVAVAVKPHEDFGLVAELIDAVDMLLCMTVQPGFGGQAFMPEGLESVRRAAAARAAKNDGFQIQVDGGIAAGTIAAAAQAGANNFVAGSAVFGAEDRAGRIRELRELALANLPDSVQHV